MDSLQFIGGHATAGCVAASYAEGYYGDLSGCSTVLRAQNHLYFPPETIGMKGKGGSHCAFDSMGGHVELQMPLYRRARTQDCAFDARATY